MITEGKSIAWIKSDIEAGPKDFLKGRIIRERGRQDCR